LDGHTIASWAIIGGFLLLFVKHWYRNGVAAAGHLWPWTVHRYYRLPGVVTYWLGWALLIGGFTWKFTHPGSS
jgi:hypothetical protein